MTATQFHIKALGALYLTIIGATVVDHARADVDQCVASHSKGQLVRDEGKLIEAQALFLSCASDVSCPAPVREECEQYLTSVSQLTPTLTFAARDQLGRDVDGVRVYLDGQYLSEVSHAVPAPVNPGPHLLRFEPPQGSAIEQKLVAVPGEKARLVAVEFTVTPRVAAPVVAPTPATGQSSDFRQISTYALGGLAVVGFAGFTVFGLQGKTDEEDLRASCAPNCSADQKHAVAQKYLLADVSLLVGSLSLAAGATLYFLPVPTSEGTGAAMGLVGAF